MLSDGKVLALVASSGSVEWLCGPRMDSPSIFAAILDRSAGSFRVGPRETWVTASRRYAPGTLILETTWMTSTGWLVVRDALLVGPWTDDPVDVPPYRRAPRQQRAEHVLLRISECVHGAVEVDVDCRAVLDYGERTVAWTLDDAGGRATARRPTGLSLELVSTAPLTAAEGRAGATVVLREGERAAFELSWGGAPSRRLRSTLRRRDSPPHSPTGEGGLGRDRFRIIPGAAICSGARSCSRVSSTHPRERCSPRAPRHCQRRPAASATATTAPRGSATRRSRSGGLSTLGLSAEADDFMRFVADVAADERDPLHIMYGIGGERWRFDPAPRSARS